MELYRAKNVATYITFPIVDADGDTVTGATALDSEIDQWADGAAPTGFADCTNEATEIGTTGIYYLLLTQAEMNEDYIYIQVKTTSSGAKTQHILINTKPITANVTQVAGTAQTAGDLKNDLNTLLTRIPTLVKVDMETVINAYEPAKISVSGRLFDVSANGNVGIDWNNIDTPGATQNLSGTTVSAVSGATGSVTGNVGGDVLGSVAALGVNAINNNSIHSNACAKISDSGIQRGASNWENNADNRSLAWAISKLVNKVDLNAAGDTLTIRKSNDSTALFTQTVTTSGGAAPITAVDTV